MKLTESDREVTEFYTSAVGLNAQGYEPQPTGGVYDGDVAMMSPSKLIAMARYRTVDGTLSMLPLGNREILRAVYAPHGTGFANQRVRPGVEGPDLLALALVPGWGGGSFVRLALSAEATTRAYSKRYPAQSTDPGRLLLFLSGEAGAANQKLFRRLRDECEQLRTASLGAYEIARLQRIEREKVVREDRRKDNEDRLQSVLGRMSHRAAERFERRLRGAA